MAPMPQPRYSSAAVTIGDEGFILGGSVTGGVKTGTVAVYHHCNNTWTTAESMLVARHRFGAAALGYEIYAFGGWGNGGVLLNHAECYSGTWSAIETLSVKRGSVMSAAVDGKVYCIGGWNGTTSYATVEEYDPGTGHWMTKRPMPTARAEGMAAVLDGVIYCIGGTTNGGDVLDVVEAYDPAADSWFTCASIPTARLASVAVAASGGICVAGGVGPGLTNTHAAEIYYPARDTWVNYDPLPSSRRYVTGFGLFGNRVYVVGGLDSLMQPGALNERSDVPSGIAELPAAVRTASAAGRICRPGELVLSPFGEQRFSARVYDCAGNLDAGFAGAGSFACPPLPAGVYLVWWHTGTAETVTRLLVLGD